MKGVVWTNRSVSGTYTVEAAFIVPMLCGIIFAYMMLVFYLRDYVVLHGRIMEAAVCMAEEENSTEYAENWQEMMQKGLWMLQVTDGKIVESKSSVKASIQAEIGWNVSVLQNYFNSKLQMRLQQKETKIKPSTIHRVLGKTEQEESEQEEKAQTGEE